MLDVPALAFSPTDRLEQSRLIDALDQCSGAASNVRGGMMTESNDYEWLLARERGEDVSHVPAETRARYGQLDRLIKELPAHAPSPGWKQRVLDSLDDPLETHRPRAFPSATARSPVATRRSAPVPRRRWMWGFGSGLAAVFGLGLVLFVYIHEPHTPAEPLVAVSSVSIRRGQHPHRGDGPSIGDILVVETSSERPLDLRVYGDAGEPLARCAETQGCSVERDGGRRRYRFELELQSPGAVRTVAFAGDLMPSSVVNLDADLEAARQANAEAREVSIVHVE
jgi:hypothetical protein